MTLPREDEMNLGVDPFVLTTGSFLPGDAERFCASMQDAERRALGEAELLYFRGEARQADKTFARLLTGGTPTTVASAVLGDAICSLADGDIHKALDIHHMVFALRDELPAEAPMRRMCDFFLLYFNILVHNMPDIHFPAVSVDAFSVPRSLKPMAFYAYAHYLIETGSINRAIGMAEGALIFMDKPCPVSEIYLSLIIAIGYMANGTWDKAEYYFRHAWSLSKPDGLLMPFAEYRGMLLGLLEKCLRYEEPAQYKRILELSNRYQKRWVYVHNALTGERISDNLAPIEYNVASLASRGMANKEIAAFLGITVNSVRAHLRNVFNKLNVESRRDLKQFVI